MKLVDLIEAKQKYPDTAAGAKLALMSMGDASVRKTFADSKYTPDPSVEGVWKATAGGKQAIIYLAGYKDSFGKVRDEDDFEIGE